MDEIKARKLVMFITDEVFITHDRIVHIIKQRRPIARAVIAALPAVLSAPDKIGDNSDKRECSFLYCKKMPHMIIRVVVQETKMPGIRRVISAFPMPLKEYEKLIDISGRAHTSSI